jgi:hypothetical protein
MNRGILPGQILVFVILVVLWWTAGESGSYLRETFGKDVPAATTAETLVFGPLFLAFCVFVICVPVLACSLVVYGVWVAAGWIANALCGCQQVQPPPLEVQP